MDKLFGIPTGQLTLVILAVFAVGALIVALIAVRDLTSFRMAVRNVPRRRAQTALIIVGLMLATLLFSAAFTTGDTLTESLRTQALENIGRVDVIVKADQPESGGGAPFGPGAGGPVVPEARERYFDEDLAGKMRDRLADESVAGVAPLAKETVPVTSPQTDLSEPRVDVLGMDTASMENFDGLTTASGAALVLGELGANEVYVSQQTAEGLDVDAGDKVEAALLQSSEQPVGEQRPPEVKIAGIYELGANPAFEASMVMPLEELQKLVGEEGKVNEVLITHGGPAVEGGEHTDSTVAAIEPLLADNGLEADPVKKDAIDVADTGGEIFSTLFVLFGQFSVAAGMLLIFLIFVMLAAERKKELGIARAVGMQRSHLISTFVFEGALYALAASTMGSVAGVGVGWVMVRLLGKEFAGGEGDLRIVFASSPENVVLAFCMGMVLTFAVVLISSWRVSRLNVVRAIRDLPEPDRRGRTVWGVLVAVSLLLAGSVAFWQGFATETMAFYLGGISLVLIGAALLARVLGLPDRVAFTASGLVLLALWLVPARITAPAGMAKGPEMFFVSGIAIVVAGVWIAIFNADALLWVVVAIFGRIRGLPPVLKTAVKYPTQSLFRTGMTLAMFMLVVFTLTAMNFVQIAMGAAFGDTQELSGGFEIQGNAGYAAPISDMEAALEDTKGIGKGDVTAVGEVSNLPAEVKQSGTDRDPEPLYVQGVDEGYTDSVGYGFETTAGGYGSAREVWKALQTEKNTVAISSDLAPSRNSSGFANTEPPVKLTGFYADDENLPDDLYLQVKDSDPGKTRDLRVI